MKLPSTESVFFSGTALIVGVLVIYPISMLLFGSFFTQGGALTLRNWQEAMTAPFLWEAFWNTAYVSLIATAIAILVGTGLAFIVVRTDTPGKRYFEVIPVVPFLTPPIVSSAAWTMLASPEGGILNRIFGGLGLNITVNILSIPGLIFASTLYMIPFVFYLTTGVMRQINPELEDASTMSGGSKLRTFFRVTLPLLLPGITSGAVLAFVYSIGLFGIHAVIGMPANIWLLTTAIYTNLNVIPVNFYVASIQGLLLLALGGGAMGIQSLLLRKGRFITITGKGFRSKEIRMGMWRWLCFVLCLLYVTLVTVIPYLVIFYRSMKMYALTAVTTWGDVVSNWEISGYTKQLQDPPIQRAIINSVWLSTAAGIIVMVLTGIVAFMAVRTKVRGRNVLGFICMIPIAMPGVVLGVAAIFAYSRQPLFLYGTIWILLVAYVTMTLPFGLKSAESSFRQIDPELEDAARVSGASWLRRFWTVTLPLVKPGMVAGFIIVFANMIRELGASIILYTHGNEVFAYITYGAWEDGRWQKMSAIIVINALVAVTFVVCFLWLMRARFRDLTAQVKG